MSSYLSIFVVSVPILAWLVLRSRAKGGGDSEVNPKRILRSFLEWFGELGIFCGQLVRASLTPPYEGREFLRQLDEVGSKSLLLIALAGAATGVVMSLQMRESLVRFGAKVALPAVIILSIIRETGPIITGLVMSGRVGAGIGAEMGAMKVSEQIDAMAVSGVNPYKYLVATRVVACALALPLLTLVANFSGIMMGWISTTLADPISLQYFLTAGFKPVTFSDFVPPTLKAVVFGAIIGVVGCFQGMRSRGGSEGVGRSATTSVVIASLFVILADVVLVRLILTLFPY